MSIFSPRQSAFTLSRNVSTMFFCTPVDRYAAHRVHERRHERSGGRCAHLRGQRLVALAHGVGVVPVLPVAFLHAHELVERPHAEIQRHPSHDLHGPVQILVPADEHRRKVPDILHAQNALPVVRDAPGGAAKPEERAEYSFGVRRFHEARNLLAHSSIITFPLAESIMRPQAG